MKLPEIGCSGDLTVTSASENELQLVAQMDDNRKGECAASGLVRLTRTAAGLSFYWEDAADSTNQASGALLES